MAEKIKQAICQSCGMPIADNSYKGTEADGTFSADYCIYCYNQGRFMQSDISFEEMLEKGRKGLDATPMPKIQKWLFKKLYPIQLKSLKRWKK
ncbi:zinc ribbon domain-containing protein [Lactococcus nasutitermitis]|uniref:Zinc ribbon domain-containing protein n=1 Tax=Lactococcus nasutitermitis TaxID=1652957 RepID=A0ABV9JCI3_9LACT|nr:zinc ribbon domain-containing protein [Lactococcus nasutitermitis]